MNRVLRYASNPYVRLAVLLAILVIASVVLGSEPWGPN
jgi:hypothetical protein